MQPSGGLPQVVEHIVEPCRKLFEGFGLRRGHGLQCAQASMNDSLTAWSFAQRGCTIEMASVPGRSRLHPCAEALRRVRGSQPAGASYSQLERATHDQTGLSQIRERANHAGPCQSHRPVAEARDVDAGELDAIAHGRRMRF